MIKKVSVLTILVAFVVSTAGCAMKTAGGIAPSTTPITDRDSYVEIGPATGSSWGLVLLFFTLHPGSTASAVQHALDTSGADALINVTTDNVVHNFGLMIIYRIKVSGTAVEMK